MSNFATMLKFFDTSTTEEIPCEDCGETIIVDSRSRSRKKLCDKCRQERSDERNQRRLEKSRITSFGDPCLDLAYAVISQAIEDGQNGDYHSREFLGAEDGAELWLRVVGVEVDDDTQKLLKDISRTGKKGLVNRGLTLEDYIKNRKPRK